MKILNYGSCRMPVEQPDTRLVSIFLIGNHSLPVVTSCGSAKYQNTHQ